MAGANYEYCPVCDTKALYIGEDDIPDGVVVLHESCRQRETAAAVAAERERITRVLLGCQSCGKIHESRQAGGLRTAADPDDGHPYLPPVSTDRPAERRRIADLIAGDGR